MTLITILSLRGTAETNFLSSLGLKISLPTDNSSRFVKVIFNLLSKTILSLNLTQNNPSYILYHNKTDITNYCTHNFTCLYSFNSIKYIPCWHHKFLRRNMMKQPNSCRLGLPQIDHSFTYNISLTHSLTFEGCVFWPEPYIHWCVSTPQNPQELGHVVECNEQSGQMVSPTMTCMVRKQYISVN